MPQFLLRLLIRRHGEKGQEEPCSPRQSQSRRKYCRVAANWRCQERCERNLSWWFGRIWLQLSDVLVILMMVMICHFTSQQVLIVNIQLCMMGPLARSQLFAGFLIRNIYDEDIDMHGGSSKKFKLWHFVVGLVVVLQSMVLYLLYIYYFSIDQFVSSFVCLVGCFVSLFVSLFGSLCLSLFFLLLYESTLGREAQPSEIRVFCWHKNRRRFNQRTNGGMASLFWTMWWYFSSPNELSLRNSWFEVKFFTIPIWSQK